MSAAPDTRHLRRFRRLSLTHHAVEQYVARHGGTEEECRALADRAVPTNERTSRGGQEVWTADGVRFVVKRDRGLGPVAVTVLPRLSEMSGYDAADDMPDGGWW